MFKKLAAVLACLMVSVILSTAAAAAPVKVEAVGFFSHPPMFKDRDAIKQVCQGFGDQVELNLYIETAEDGQKFMKDKGLSGHLPLVLYINGSLAHKIGDRTIIFRDFMGEAWTKEDLQQVIKLNIDGQKTAVPAPANATTGFWDPKASAQGVNQAAAPKTNPTYPIFYYLGGAVLIVGIAVTWRIKSRSRK
ncbi:MAG: hypothetical protein P4N59_02180 [Negativicutes bacterium]|nr:hypothetical protein [Negativicutes bacterium]